jgi:hypothetical protein
MKTIIEMAREAGLIIDANQSGFDSVEAFEALVRADEREACAKLLEESSGTGKLVSCMSAAAAIRARGNA